MRAATVAALLSGVIVGGVCGGGLGGVGTWWVMKGRGEGAGAKQEGPKGAPLQTTTAEVFAAFNENGAAAREKYGNRVLEVTGEVAKVGETTVNLRDKTLCIFAPGEEAALAKLQIGQAVVIHGTCDDNHGRIFLMLKNCRVASR